MDWLRYILGINIRNLFANRNFTTINIIGLSVSLTACLLIFIYVRYETSFENFNPNSENIYRIVERNIQDGSIGATTPLALSDVLKSDFPEIDKVIGLIRTVKEIEVDNEKYEKTKGAIVEKEFFNLFNLSLKLGDPATIFQNPFDAVITQQFAEKLFGNSNPLGKNFEYEENTFTITGVINNIPSNSIFKFDYFLSDKYRYKSYPDINDRWYQFSLFAFVTFHGNKMPDGFEQKLLGIEKRYYPDFMKDRHNYLVTKFKGSHLDSSLDHDLVPSITPIYLWILSTIAMAILIIACLNFMNISIALSRKRIIATGMKKVNGASSGILIGEFFTEISIVVFASLFISIVGVQLLLPVFNNLIGKNITVDFSDAILWTGLMAFVIIIVFICGLYPSLLLSRSSSVSTLLHKKGDRKNKMTFQKSFVVLQFTITIILVVSQLLIFKQIFFMQNHDTGFNKENLVAMRVRSLGISGKERMKNTSVFMQELERHQVLYGYGNACVTEFIPGFGFNNRFNIFPDEYDSTNGIELLSCDIDENFIDVYDLQIIHGRSFSEDFATESDAIIINESAYKKLGWKSIDGKSFGLFSIDNTKNVVGVVTDINIRSLKHPVEPMLYQFGRHHNYPGYITVRLNSKKWSETIAFFKSKWEELFPDIPFEIESIEEKYKAAYGEEEKQAKITGVFSIIATLLSILGLIALSTLESEKRIKEIGIRKVNGAKTHEIITMLNKGFAKWVAIAFVIACPIAWYVMNKWLENFAYKTELSWWIFALAGLIAMGIALLTVSFQSWRAARRNPVESLRYE